MDRIIRVLLIDGHESIRKELRNSLSSEEGIVVIGEVNGEETSLAEATELSPDVAIVLAGDRMPDEKIVDSACAIGEAKLPVKVIIMAENPLHYLLPAIKSGAAGILSDSIGRDELLSAIRRIHLWFPSSQPSDSTLSDWDSTL